MPPIPQKLAGWGCIRWDNLYQSANAYHVSPTAPFLTRQKWGKERLGEGISIPFPPSPIPTTNRGELRSPLIGNPPSGSRTAANNFFNRKQCDFPEGRIPQGGGREAPSFGRFKVGSGEGNRNPSPAHLSSNTFCVYRKYWPSETIRNPRRFLRRYSVCLFFVAHLAFNFTAWPYNGRNKSCKGGGVMICYAPLWETMKKQKATTYTLRVKHGMSHATVQRLQANSPVSTHTLNKLCEILNCRLEDIAEYVPDPKEEK